LPLAGDRPPAKTHPHAEEPNGARQSGAAKARTRLRSFPGRQASNQGRKPAEFARPASLKHWNENGFALTDVRDRALSGEVAAGSPSGKRAIKDSIASNQAERRSALRCNSVSATDYETARCAEVEHRSIVNQHRRPEDVYAPCGSRLDARDRSILRALQMEARTTAQELSRELRLSHSAACQRVRRAHFQQKCIRGFVSENAPIRIFRPHSGRKTAAHFS
jgi:hypothetical protein